MEIYYAETPVGNVRITCNENAVTQLEFIKNNFSGIPITIPKALQCAFKENQLGKEIPLLPRGTEFQRMVWDALLNVPFGQTVSYGEIAILLGGKEKARAVGAAVATNPVAILIPCHRALPTNGKIQMGRGSEEKLARLGNCKQ